MVKLVNLDFTKEIVFDGGNYVLNEKDLGKAEINLASFQGYNQIGVKVAGRVINQRDISLVGFILADDEKEMLDKKRNLQQMVNPLEDFFLVIDNYKIRVSASSSIEYAIAHYENNKYLTKFLINGVCANPCFTELQAKTVPLAAWLGRFRFPLAMNKSNPAIMGVKLPSKMRMIENEGATETGMIIHIKALQGNIQNPYIQNILTGEKLLLNCTMAEGETIDINTNYGEKSVIQNGKTNFIHKVDLDSDFLQLHVGENYLEYGADANDKYLEIEIEFSPQFLEV